jgi:hypothetical protein
MRKIFKIKFEFTSSSNKSIDRDQNIDNLLSEIQDIESDSPLPIPSDGSIFEMAGEEYKVISHKFSFNIEDGSFYYKTILKIKSLKQIKQEESKKAKSDNDELIRKLVQLAGVRSKSGNLTIEQIDDGSDFF